MKMLSLSPTVKFSNLTRPFLVSSKLPYEEKEEKEEKKSKHVIIERREVIPYRMITKEEFLSSSQDENNDCEKHFDQYSVELTSFEANMFEQYREVCSAFNSLCIRKLAQRKPAIYDLMSKIYGVFEKYGIESGNRDRQARFTESRSNHGPDKTI